MADVDTRTAIATGAPMGASTRLARALGVVLHPAVPGFFVALYAALEHEGGLTLRLISVALLVSAVCVGLPLASLGVAHLLGRTAGDVLGERRETRVFWFYPAAALGLVLAWLVFLVVYPFPLARVMVSAAGGVIVLLALANRRLKASIHVAGNVAIAVAASWTYGAPAAFTFLFVPAIAWARVRARKHTPREVLVGGAIGLVATLSALLLSGGAVG